VSQRSAPGRRTSSAPTREDGQIDDRVRQPVGAHHLRNHPDLDIIGLPAIEIYRMTRVGQRDAMARASIAIPVRSRRGRKPECVASLT
jgi:hypothetical protein